MKRITDEIKLNDKVIVTLIDKGEFTYLTNGTKTKFKVSYKGSIGFNLTNHYHRALMHLNEWEKSYGLFEIDRGMIIKIEKYRPLFDRIFSIN